MTKNKPVRDTRMVAVSPELHGLIKQLSEETGCEMNQIVRIAVTAQAPAIRRGAVVMSLISEGE